MFVRAVLLLIRVYQLTLSRVLGPACRFEPSCSRYAVACLRTHGALRGGLLSVRRLCKCHPFHPGGYDPPPPARSHANHATDLGPRAAKRDETRDGPRYRTNLRAPIVSFELTGRSPVDAD
ncbi:MAG TPA: membrane protein insertion efficiency factor YidD [Polyangiaceae bacterium]|nr:membrane protein insertion efficiency factor YidD [Polyangiaceae bacterium]